MLIVLNFAHPLTAEQVGQIEELCGQKVQQVIHLPIQFDSDEPFIYQLKRLTSELPLSPEALQCEPLLVNLPSLNYIAALLLADLHGRMGYFPPILRFNITSDRDRLPRYEIAEILNLQAVRNAARETRYVKPK